MPWYLKITLQGLVAAAVLMAIIITVSKHEKVLRFKFIQKNSTSIIIADAPILVDYSSKPGNKNKEAPVQTQASSEQAVSEARKKTLRVKMRMTLQIWQSLPMTKSILAEAAAPALSIGSSIKAKAPQK